MGYSKQLRQIRQARKAVRAWQHQMLALELEGITALTLHSATKTLIIPIEREAGAQVIGTLLEALNERRKTLQAEARQLRQDWHEHELLHGSQDRTHPARGRAD
ncbi:hypothetical protein [Hymenobacter canadensis]|uniref:Uncharacterized protein n=1 Tax=Hymenobacter canadensis TaxID=2999067 RepID=A0ABY7LVE6_9BACT|nr:hypothetical protein [Hymenobacter canadensis]WBA44021.1 hypothetical protein O3303_20890 [Hymenobacter canadensis]